jgi:hypothetical protein
LAGRAANPATGAWAAGSLSDSGASDSQTGTQEALASIRPSIGQRPATMAENSFPPGLFRLIPALDVMPASARNEAPEQADSVKLSDPAPLDFGASH